MGYYYDIGDDEYYYYIVDDYYGNNIVYYDDDEDKYLLDVNALNALNEDEDKNKDNSIYLINVPQNEEEHALWEYMIPLYGDYLSFKEAETGLDFLIAGVGVIPTPWTKGAKATAKTVKVTKAVKVKKTDVAGSAAGKVGNTANVNTVINADKFNYIFGQVTSNSHNAARSAQLSQTMKTLGVPNNAYGRNLLTEHFSKVTQESNNIVKTFSNNYGNFEIRESLFAGPSGKFVKFETTYQVLPNGTRVFNTVIPKGGQ